jgi:hypothetical protein
MREDGFAPMIRLIVGARCFIQRSKAGADDVANLVDRAEKSAYTDSIGLNGSVLTSVVLHDKSCWTNF